MAHSEEYDKYLRSAEWKKIRSKRITKDGCKCTKCGSTKNLQVHHLTYKRFEKERLGDLITLCESCHQKLEKEIKAGKRTRKGKAIKNKKNKQTLTIMKEEKLSLKKLEYERWLKNQKVLNA